MTARKALEVLVFPVPWVLLLVQADPIPEPAGPGVSPNGTGLPGLPVVRQMAGALLTWGLVACVVGIVVSVIVWVIGQHFGSYAGTSTGKAGVLVSMGGAVLIGGANAIVAFFAALGAQI